MHRAHSPLKRAADAVSLDSTGMGIDAVLHAIFRYCCGKGERKMKDTEKKSWSIM